MYCRIAEIVSPESSKKTSESVKLPPTKQNGHLVQSDEPQETKKSKKAENHDGRQIADPKRKKKSNFFIISFITKPSNLTFNHRMKFYELRSCVQRIKLPLLISCRVLRNCYVVFVFSPCLYKQLIRVLLCVFYTFCSRYMVEILPIRRKSPINQSQRLLYTLCTQSQTSMSASDLLNGFF